MSDSLLLPDYGSLGQALCQLTDDAELLILCRDLEGGWSLTKTATDRQRFTATGDNLLETLRGGIGKVERRRCRTCRKLTRWPDQFSENPDYKEGRKPVCKACERQRVSQYYPRARRGERARRRSQEAGAGPGRSP